MKMKHHRQSQGRATRSNLGQWLCAAALVCTGLFSVRAADAEALYAKARRACFEVLVDDHLAGSGWFASPTGLGFTAAHVFGQSGRRVELLQADGRRWPARLVAVDIGADAALLEVSAAGQKFPSLEFRTRRPQVGEEVFLFGSAIYRHRLLLRGTVARPDTTFEYNGDHGDYTEVFHVSATVQGGTSGAPWLDRDGKVVGLQSAVMSLNAIPVGVSFVARVDPLRRLQRQRCSAATPTLGIAVEETWQQDRGFLDQFPPRTEGLVARIVAPDQPGANAGLKTGDLIIAIDRRPVRYPDELLRWVRGRAPGQAVALRVWRPGEKEAVELQATPGLLEPRWAGRTNLFGFAAGALTH